MSTEDELRDNQDKIDEAVLRWIGKHIIITDPTSDISIGGELVAYDGGRVFVKKASSDMIEGSEIVCLLNGSMTISLISDVPEVNTALPKHRKSQGKVIELYKGASKPESDFVQTIDQAIDEEFRDLINDPWEEENMKGD